MPLARFGALYRAIPALRAEEQQELLALLAVGANPGADGEAYQELLAHLQAVASFDSAQDAATTRAAAVPVVPVGKQITVGLPGVTLEAEPGSIAAERTRQQAAWERRLAEAEALGIHINR